MKIKIKGTNNTKTITPSEWLEIVKTGNESEFEIVERNTVWAAPINNNGIIMTQQKREFELDHWHKLLDLGSKNKWKRLTNENKHIVLPKEKTDKENKATKEPVEVVEQIAEDKNLEISQLQLELTQAQINESKANTDLTTEKTKDLKRKWVYFFIGAILGNLKDIIEWFQVLFQGQ
ncbi:hypothetical protein KFZ70_00505 [Tamlana fucoidanivorans]|uniref:Uncharacterized protein n=1 Tax=Allotamlana fucoidanivorans TaxID=2583814 RepID=A0A5C4SDL7_9FLAO|nr:hypothetical protein [Tamlana fucoidanivorans]TNJ41329.1 hypothetical protein FGF67_16190 [Tamlana fucoidanivorans]